jgi:hypothetical protein
MRIKTLKPKGAVVCEGKRVSPVVRSLLSVRFLLAAAIFIFAATGLRPGMLALAKRYEKEPISTRRPLREFDPARLPSFRKGWDFTPSEKIDDDVGTDKFIFTALDRKDLNKQPGHANLFVTYYSEPRSKVPHTPDVCYRQGGFVVRQMTTIMIDTPKLAPDYPQTEAKLVLFQAPKGYQQAVIFCFCVEGKLEHNRESVRWLIGKPGNRYTYFSKIESSVAFLAGQSPAKAVSLCKTLLGEALQLLIKEYFPREEDLKRY